MKKKQKELFMQIICEIIKQTRKDKNISTVKLSSGLCHRTYISHDIETKGKVADKFLFDAILQRLGINIENFEHYVFAEDIDIQNIRIDIFDNLNIGNYDKVNLLLAQYQELKTDNIHQQFIEFIKALLLQKLSAPINEVLEQYKKAIEITLIDFEERYFLEQITYTAIESFLIFEYACILKDVDKHHALNILVHLNSYFLNENLYNLTTTPILPKLIYTICFIWYKDFNYNNDYKINIITLCGIGIESLNYDQNHYYLTKLIDLKLKCIQETKQFLEEYDKLKSWYNTLIQIYKDYSINPNDDDYVIYSQIFLWQNYSKIGYVIKNRRSMLGLSQQQLAEDICDIKTISRLENTNVKPNVGKTQLLLQKLNLSEHFYSYSFVTSNYETLNIVKNMTHYISIRDYDVASELLNQLKTCDEAKNNILNLQFIKHKELVITNKSEPISYDILSQFIDALELTIPIDILFNNSPKYITKTELNLINNIISGYANLKDTTQVLRWVYMLEKYIENSNMKSSYLDGYSFSLINISSIYGNLGYYQKSNKILLKLMIENLQNCCYNKLLQFLYHYTWNFANANANELYKVNYFKFIKLSKQVYTLASIKNDAYSLNLIRNLVKTKLNIDIDCI